MSTTIDSKIVSLQFDNKDFEKNTKSTLNLLDSLKEKLKFNGATAGLEEIGKAANKISFKNLSDGVVEVQGTFNSLQVIAARTLENITDSLYEFTTKTIKQFTLDPIVDGWSKMDKMTGSVQTLVNSTGKSVDEITSYLDDLMWFSDETSFGFTDMTSALATMVSSGGKIETLVPMIMGVANATAFAGKGANEFARVIANLNQSYSTGSLTLMDWKSVELAGANSKQLIETFIEVGESLGTIEEGAVTIENFRNSLKDKWVTSEVMEVTFNRWAAMTLEAKRLIDEGYFDTASEAYEALSGQFETFAERGAKAAQEAKTFGEAMSSVGDAVSSKWTSIFKTIFGDYNQQVTTWTNLANNLWDIFAEPLDRLNSNLQETFSSKWSSGLLEGIEQAFGMTSGDFTSGFTKYMRDTLGTVIDEETGRESYIIDNLIIKYKDLRRVFSHGELDATYIADYLATLEQVTYEEESQEEALERINSGLDMIVDSFDSISKLSGAELLSESLENIFGTILGIKYAIVDTWSEVTAGNESVSIFKIILEIVYKITDAIKNIAENSQLLRGVLKVVFTLVNQLGNAIKLVISKSLQAVSSLLGIFKIDLSKISDIVKAVFDKVTEFLSVNNIFIDALKLIFNFAESIFASIAGIFNRIIQSKEVQRVLSAISGLLVRIRNAISSISSEMVKSGFQKVIDSIGKALSKVFNFISSIVSMIYKSEPVQWMIEKIKQALIVIADYIDEVNFNKLLKDISSGLKSVWTWMTGIYNNVKNTLVEFYKSEKVQNFLEGFNKQLLNIKENIKNIDLKEFGNDLRESFKNAFDDLKSGKINPFEYAGKSLGILWNNIKTFFSNLITGTLEVSSTIKKSIGGFIEENQLEDRFQSFTEVLIGLGAGYLVLTNIGKALDTIVSLIKPLTSITDLIGSAKGVLDATSGYIKSLTANKTINNIVKVAVALGIFAGAIYLLAKIDSKALWTTIGAIGALAAIIAGLALVLQLIGKIKVNSTNFAALGSALISFAASIAILAVALKIMSGVQNLVETVNAMASIMLAIVGSMILLNKFAKDIKKLSGTLISFAVAIGIMAIVFKLLSGTSWEAIGKSLVGLLGVVTAISLIGIVMSKIDPKQGAAKELIVYAASLILFVYAIKSLAKMDIYVYVTGLMALIPLLAALVIISNTLKVASKKSQSTGAYILALAYSLILVTKAIKTLGKMEVGQILKGSIAAIALLASMGAIMVVMSQNMKSTKGWKNALSAAAIIVAMSASLYLVAGAVYLFGNMKTETLLKGVSAIVAVVLAFGGAMKLMSGFKPDANGIKALVSLVPLLITLVASVVILSFIDTASLITAVAGMSVLLLSLGGFMAIMGGVAKLLSTSQSSMLMLVGLIGLMILVVSAMTGLVYLISKIQNVEVATAALMKISQAMLILSGVMTVLTILSIAVVATGGIVLAAIGAMSAIMAALVGLVVFIASKLTVDEGLIAKLDFAALIMQKVGEVIGGFFGGLIGGFAGAALDSFTKSLESVGTHLSNFMENISGFVEKVKGISTEDLDKAKIVAEMIGALGSLNTIAAISRINSNGTFFDNLGETLDKYGESIVRFSETISGKVDSSAVQAAADAGLMFANLSDSIPKESGGLWGLIAGSNKSIADFGKDMESFAKSLVNVSKTMGSNGGFDKGALESAKQAGEMFLALADSMPEGTSLKSLIAGGNGTSLTDFGKDMEGYTNSLVTISTTLSGVNIINDSQLTAATNVGYALSELAKSMPEGTSLKSLIAGGNGISLKDFGTDMIGYVESIVTISSTLAGVSIVDDTVLASAINVGAALADLATKMPEGTSLKSIFAGGNYTSIKDFGKDMEGYAQSVVNSGTLLASMSAVSEDKLNAAVLVGSTMAGILNSLSNVEDASKAFNLEELGTQMVSYIQSLVAVSGELDSIGNSVMTTVVMTSMQQMYDEILLKMDEIANGVIAHLRTLVSVGKGGKGKDIKSAMDTVLEYFNRKDDAIAAGKNTLDGLCIGLTDSGLLERIREAGRNAARAFNEAYRSTLEVHSPSRVMAEAGSFTILGLIKGIESQYNNLYDAGETSADIMLGSIAKSIELADQIVEDGGLNPVITPVLDLSQVRQGMNGLNGAVIQNGVYAQGIIPSGNILNGRNLNNNTVNIDFKIDNSGKDITDEDIGRWSKQITNQVNIELGKMI